MATETREEKVVRLARQGVERAMREFTITKMSRHEMGYLHARITPAGGRPIYVHRRFGSWMAPGKIGDREVMKELESFGLPQAAKVELQRKARALERAETGDDDAPDDTAAADADTGSTPDA